MAIHTEGRRLALRESRRLQLDLWLVGGWTVGLLFTGRLSRFFLRMCNRGFKDLLSVRPSSLFLLNGCISISMASLMRRSMYLVLAERSLVSCSRMVWSWLKLCSATADLSGCASLVSFVFFNALMDGPTTLSNVDLSTCTGDPVDSRCFKSITSLTDGR